MASSSRQPNRNPSKAAKASKINVDELANEISQKLKINDGKGKKKASNEDSKLLAMRAVNSASQELTNFVQNKSSPSLSSRVTVLKINSSAAVATKNLAILRTSLADLDVERAAASIVGKLVALDMFELAASALFEMRPRLCMLLETGEVPTNPLTIPEPSIPPTNPILLKLISSFLVHAVIVHTQLHNSREHILNMVNTPSGSLLSWLPHLSLLPAKHQDSLLTRSYTTLNLASSKSLYFKPCESSEDAFNIRKYALRCLACTSPGVVVQPTTFWIQAISYANAFAATTPPALEDKNTTIVLDFYAEVVQLVEQRSDRTIFMTFDENNKGFGSFCESWMDFAKRAGDISILKKINGLLQRPSSSIAQFPDLSPAAVPANEANHHDCLLEGRRLHNSLSQLLLAFEKSGEELLEEIKNTVNDIKTSPGLKVLLKPQPQTTEKLSKEENDLVRMCGKIDRVFERVRRNALKYVELHASSLSRVLDDAIQELLLECVSTLKSLLSLYDLKASSTRDILTRSIDTLFTLAKTKLSASDPTTFIPAFEYLSQSVSILNSIPQDRFPTSPIENAVDIGNYTRCISGAFYNLAGTLYQASRFGNSVPFLIESCVLGAKALRLPHIELDAAREKEWTQLEDQLYRRWELLAVCYSKNGDRRNAYSSFKQAVLAFPFASSGLLPDIDKVSIQKVFETSLVKPLVALIDRVSYVGACELLLPPVEVSLLSLRESADESSTPLLDPLIVGALLEKQLDSLEPSRWKEGVRTVIIKLLRDVLQIYSASGDTSVRRARTLIRCMEFVYRDEGPEACSELGFANVEDIGREVEVLAKSKTFGRDGKLSHYLYQYRISAHLWLALNAHRRVDPEQHKIIPHHTEESCRLIKELLAPGHEASPKALRKGNSPKISKIKGSRLVSPKQTRPIRQRIPAAPKKAKPAPTRAKPTIAPVTPQPRTQVLPSASFKTPPRRSNEVILPNEGNLIFDDFDNFFSLLQISASILGFLSLLLPKAHLLDATRKIAQRHSGSNSDGYVSSSLDLAHEYVTLGKVRKAIAIFNPALEIVRSGEASDEVAVKFLLRFAESLALAEDVNKSSATYIEALEVSRRLELEQKGSSMLMRIHGRVKTLEIIALASHVFALVQFAKGDISASLEGFLQSLRLWNRAVDVLSRLGSGPRTSPEADPFVDAPATSSTPESFSKDTARPVKNKFTTQRSPVERLEWRVSEGLLSTMFFLTQAYYLRGSAREAEYFARQAAELAEQLNSPSMTSRALAKLAEIHLHMGRFQEAQGDLTKAGEHLSELPGIDIAEVQRLKAQFSSSAVEEENTRQAFDQIVMMLDELDAAFSQFENLVIGVRRSLGTSPSRKLNNEVLAPELQASILSQQLWLLRDESGDNFNSTLQKYLALSYSKYNKAEENALMARLILHRVYGRFRTDMFLGSLTESTIAVPVGMSRQEERLPILSSKEIIDALITAEEHLWSHLNLTASRGNVIKIREAAISLVMIGVFRTSLGDWKKDQSSVMTRLLDGSAALTLRRDMLDAIEHKFLSSRYVDDLQWPLLSEDGIALSSSANFSSPSASIPILSEFPIDDDEDGTESLLKNYWDSVRAKYRDQAMHLSSVAPSEMVDIPRNWSIINISVTPDKGNLFISRMDGGQDSSEPLIFCIPMKGRRDHGTGDDEHLRLDGAIDELKDIIRSSDELTKSAISIKPEDMDARGKWWKERGDLDVRMRELLDNIEYCWLGAFKAILSPQPSVTAEGISALRIQIEKVFHLALHVKEKRPKSKSTTHKKSSSQVQTNSPTQFVLDDAIVRCFSTLSPKCRDEEFEDLVYFILDLYQLHGVPIAIAEVDIDQVVVDIRTVLEEYNAKAKEKLASEPAVDSLDEHLFLVLDKTVQGIPWESIPILRGRSVSRIPGVQFLQDRLSFARMKQESCAKVYEPRDGAIVDFRKGYFILNPSGDLPQTEERFREWALDMKKIGWDGVMGQAVSEQQLVNALKSQDLVVYFGHGGGEQYIRSHRVRSLPTCAATMLWGCSSGELRDMGNFDRSGTPYNYMLAGCPNLVANLWDVTDKDIDKVSQSVFDKLGLTCKDLTVAPSKKPISIVAAVAQSRDSCKLKYLTGAAPVVYGIPYYI